MLKQDKVAQTVRHTCMCCRVSQRTLLNCCFWVHSPNCTQPHKKYRNLTSPKPHLKHEASYKPWPYAIKLLLIQTSTTNPNPPILTQHCRSFVFYTHRHPLTHTHAAAFNTCIEQHVHTHICVLIYQMQQSWFCEKSKNDWNADILPTEAARANSCICVYVLCMCTVNSWLQMQGESSWGACLSAPLA